MAYKAKVKYVGKHGLGNVYKTKKGLFAIHQYGNLTEIVPVKKTKSFGFAFDEKKGHIDQVPKVLSNQKKSDRYFAENYIEKNAGIK